MTEARAALRDAAAERAARAGTFESSAALAEFWAGRAGRFMAIVQRIAEHLPSHLPGAAL